ncbi:MAG: hypothetical protein S0880_34735 [Actinomycetota bacterium]|nr:hypothetical protein [Actinomycetota bacterium]
MLAHLVLPDRTYILLTGRVDAATRLRCPGGMFDWQRPGLCWPDDQRWFVATDVDFWSLYVGCGNDLAAALTERVPTTVEVVSYDDALVRED